MPILRDFNLFRESFRLALSSLRSSKLRTSLTLLGIVVGVTAVIAVVTIINGLDSTVAEAFSAQGSTVFSVSKRPLVVTSREDFIKFNKRKDVTPADAEVIGRLCVGCARIGTSINGAGMVKYAENRSDNVTVRGLSLPMFAIENIVLDSGRAWTDQEGKSGQNVCIVGTDIVENLFPGMGVDAVLGKSIKVDGTPFRILGVSEPFGKVL
ncbi:MAG: ABC transporter permease, partial [Pyrinomonadaceae bacterium]